MTARHRAFNERTRGTLIVEESAFLQRLITRLIGHLLLARAQSDAENRQAPEYFPEI
jgi:hypothetical protein